MGMASSGRSFAAEGRRFARLFHARGRRSERRSSESEPGGDGAEERESDEDDPRTLARACEQRERGAEEEPDQEFSPDPGRPAPRAREPELRQRAEARDEEH